MKTIITNGKMHSTFSNGGLSVSLINDSDIIPKGLFGILLQKLGNNYIIQGCYINGNPRNPERIALKELSREKAYRMLNQAIIDYLTYLGEFEH